MRSANLAIKFCLELAALAAFGYWGTTLPGAALSATIATAAPLAMIVLWGMLAAPRSRRRLPKGTRIPFGLTVLALQPEHFWWRAEGHPSDLTTKRRPL